MQNILPDLRSAMSAVCVSALLAVMFACLFFWFPETVPYSPATCLSSHCFCEAPRSDTSVAQPSNSLSSFAFLFVSILILLTSARNSRPSNDDPYLSPKFNQLQEPFWLATAAFAISVGSAYFHATLSLYGQFLDVSSMYLLASFVIARAVARLSDFKYASVLVGLAAIFLLSCAMLFFFPETRRYWFAGLIVVGLILEKFAVRTLSPLLDQSLLWSSVAAISVGYVFWLLDNTLTICAPHSVFQGHSLWHFAGALSVFLLYRYYENMDLQVRRLNAQSAQVKR
jgi:Ceramidase